MRKLGITIELHKINAIINHVNMPENTIERNITTVKRKFTKLFTENQTVKKHRSGHTIEGRNKIDQTKRYTGTNSFATRRRKKNRQTEKNRGTSKKR